MKGAMSSPGPRMSEVIHHGLFPDITYGVNSGGLPSDITELTYEELLNFHKKYYHPRLFIFLLWQHALGSI